MASDGNGAAPNAVLHEAAAASGVEHASAPATAASLRSARRPEIADAMWPTHTAAPVRPTAADESVDVGALFRTIARGWRVLLVGSALGVLAGLAVTMLFPPRYRAAASVLVRNANDPTGSVLSKLGGGGDLAGVAAVGALGGVLSSPLETELQLLESRELVGQVVDSLAMQVRVLSPHGIAARTLFRPGAIPGSFRRRDVTFSRSPDGSYMVLDADGAGHLTPGQPGVVPGIGTVTLTAGVLPAQFEVRISDREDAITDAAASLTVEKKGGELVDIRYTGPDSITAANVPNYIISGYLAQRRTVDRGMNQRRYEFMAAQADSAARQLAAAEDALRREEESSGVLDPEATGKSGLEAIQQVRTQLVGLDAERQAAHALVSAVQNGSLSPRQLTAFPSFLRAPAINSILTQITNLETERTRLLGARTERDPDVQVLSTSIADLERGLLPLASTYAASLEQQVSSLAGEQRAVETRLDALPREAEGGARRQRDVRRLSQTVLALQTQMIDARLSALSEGGQVRGVDAATVPKRPVFPRAVYTVPVGLLVGLVAAVAVVLARGAWSSRVYSAADAERASGLPVVEFRAGAPLLLGAGARHGTLLAIGMAAATRAVAETLAEQARARGQDVVTLDATELENGTHATGEARRLGDELTHAESTYDAVYVASGPVSDLRTAVLLDPDRAVALVARIGVTTRHDLADAAQTLMRLRVPVIAVVLTSPHVS